MDLQFAASAEKRNTEEQEYLISRSEKESKNPPHKRRSYPIKFDLSEKAKDQFLPHYNLSLRKEILEEITIDELENSNEFLQYEVRLLLKEITDLPEINLFSSEWEAFSKLSEYYKQNAPSKLIIVLGKPEFPIHPNYLYIQQLCDLKDILLKPHRIAAILVDPFFFIMRTNDFHRRIAALKKQCSGSGIHFILDERKTAARIHLKGLNFIYQFKADAILIGGNFTNGMPFAAIASSRSTLGNSSLSGANAPSSLALKACLKITGKLIELGNPFYTAANIKANRFAEIINQRSSSKKDKIKVHNFGTVIWLTNTRQKNLVRKLKEKGIYAPNILSMNLPLSLDVKDFTDLIHRFSLAIKKPSRTKSGRPTNKTTI
jgi:hypothetical protein